MIEYHGRRKEFFMSEEQKQDFKFDFNKFTQAACRFGESNGTNGLYDNCNRLIYGLITEYSPSWVKNFQENFSPKNDEEFHALTDNAPEDFKYIVTTLYNVYKNPASKEAQEFANYWQFIAPLFVGRPSGSHLELIAKKISVFDEQTQFQILQRVYSLINVANIPPQMTPLFFNNSFVPLRIKADVAGHSTNQDMKIETIELLKKEIDTELQKDFPNIWYLQELCNAGQFVSRSIDNNELLNQYVKYFDVSAVVSGDANYIRKLQKTAEEKALEADASLKEKDKALKEKNAEIEELKKQLEAATQSHQKTVSAYEKKIGDLEMVVEDKDKKIEKETQKNRELTKEMDVLQKTNQESKDKLHRLKLILGKMKIGGLFNKNADEIKKMQDIVDSYTL